MKSRKTAKSVMKTAQYIAALGQTKPVEDRYQTITPREHVLQRPEMYIGSKRHELSKIWDNDGALTEMSIAPGLAKIIDELLVNAADNYHRTINTSRPTTNLDVNIDYDTGAITITNNGRCIDVAWHETAQMYCPELVFGEFQAGSNFDDSAQRITGGRNGVGATVANTLCEYFKVEVADTARGLLYVQEWHDSMSRKSAPSITPITAPGTTEYTRVTFKPLYSFFNMSTLDMAHTALFQRRVRDISACCPGLTVYLNGERISGSGFVGYVREWFGAGAAKNEDVSVGAESLVETSIRSTDGHKWEIVTGPGAISNFSFVNAICTSSGGAHIRYVKGVVVKAVVAHIKELMPSLKMQESVVRDNISIFINALISNPEFDAQTKDKLTYPSMREVNTLITIPHEYLERICENKQIIDPILDLLRRPSFVAKRPPKAVLIPKLEDAKEAGSTNSKYCSLIITEGDSAKSLAVAGLSVVGRKHFGVYPVRGKLLNVSKTTMERVDSSKLLQELQKVLGLKTNLTYQTEEEKRTLRYGSISLMCDQDHDGMHIKGLIINWIAQMWPALLEQGLLMGPMKTTTSVPPLKEEQRMPFLRQITTPLVKATAPGEADQWFFSQEKAEEFRAKNEGTDKDWTYKYYKGLGSSTSKEGREYFQMLFDKSKPLLRSFDHMDEADSVALATAFNSCVSKRRQWLTSEITQTDSAPQSISHFVETQLSSYFHYSNLRAIPCFMDGLKPSLRKVLFTCLERGIDKKETRVAQLSGAVSERTNYHHGELSLQEGIIKMAQRFVGSGNNIPLLEDVGQFGTRLAGGQDHASPRYISTKLSPLARALFRPEDDMLLERATDEGREIEPTYFVPILPLLLVNGSQGIGSGFSTNIPSYDPLVIVSYLFSTMSLAQNTDCAGNIAHVQDISQQVMDAQQSYSVLLEQLKKQHYKTALGQWRERTKVTKKAKRVPGQKKTSDAVRESQFIARYIRRLAETSPEKRTLDEKKVQLQHVVMNHRFAKANPVYPWYHGHRAPFGKRKSKGRFTIIRDTAIVTELPVGEWTDNFKSFIEDQIVKKVFRSFENNSCEATVDFRIKLAADANREPTAAAVKILEQRLQRNHQQHAVVVRPDGFTEQGAGMMFLSDPFDVVVPLYMPKRLELYKRRVDAQLEILDTQMKALQIDVRLANLVREPNVLRNLLSGKMKFSKVAEKAGVPADKTNKMSATRLLELTPAYAEKSVQRLQKRITALKASEPTDLWKQELLQFLAVYFDYFNYKLSELEERMVAVKEFNVEVRTFVYSHFNTPMTKKGSDQGSAEANAESENNNENNDDKHDDECNDENKD